MTKASTAAIVGPGNIGTDLLVKLISAATSSTCARWSVSIPTSDGLARARALGVETSPRASTGCLPRTSCPISSSRRPRRRPTRQRAALCRRPASVRRPDAGGDRPVRLPAGQPVVQPRRAQRQHDHVRWPGDDPHRARGLPVVPVPYAEIVASIVAPSAGPGTRANIDEFTETTPHAIEPVGGAGRGKAIIILNPVDPPMIMRDTVFCAIPPEQRPAASGPVLESIHAMVAQVQEYVPGYTPARGPAVRPGRRRPGAARRASSILLEVAGTRRLPARVRGQPRHHDRRRRARR